MAIDFKSDTRQRKAKVFKISMGRNFEIIIANKNKI